MSNRYALHQARCVRRHGGRLRYACWCEFITSNVFQQTFTDIGSYFPRSSLGTFPRLAHILAQNLAFRNQSFHPYRLWSSRKRINASKTMSSRNQKEYGIGSPLTSNIIVHWRSPICYLYIPVPMIAKPPASFTSLDDSAWYLVPRSQVLEETWGRYSFWTLKATLFVCAMEGKLNTLCWIHAS